MKKKTNDFKKLVLGSAGRKKSGNWGWFGGKDDEFDRFSKSASRDRQYRFALSRIDDINVNGKNYQNLVIKEISGMKSLSPTDKQKLIKKAQSVKPDSGW